MGEQIAWYQYPGNKEHDLWYKCRKRGCTVYLYFPDNWEGDHEIELALKVAIEKDTCALRVTRKCPESALSDNPQPSRLRDRLIFTPCEYKPYIPHFNSDFVSVDHDELVEIKQLAAQCQSQSLFVNSNLSTNLLLPVATKTASKPRSKITKNWRVHREYLT